MLKADNLTPSCAVVTKSGYLDFLEPSGPLQACNRTALPLPLPIQLSGENEEGQENDIQHNQALTFATSKYER